MAIWSRFFGGAASTAAGFGIGTALGPPLTPLTQELTNATWRANPTAPLSPADAATALIRELLDADGAAFEAASSGMSQERFNVLAGLAGEPPGAQQLLELWNRQALTEAQVDTGLRQSRMRPEWYGAFKALANVLVPVSDLIRFAVREVFNPAQRSALQLDAEYPAALTARAQELGLSEQAAREYWAAHWQLPSREEGAEMLFRGEITQAQFSGLLKALDYSPAWRDELEAISRRIPALQDMIRFAVREVYSPAQRSALGLDSDYPAVFTEKAAQHGLNEQDAKDYWAAHWRLPSAEQGYHMLWRGEITEAQLDELLKALDYPLIWRDRLANIARLVPGRIDLRRMFAAGILTEAELVAGYGRLGYAPQDAQRLAELAKALSAGGTASSIGKAQTQLWGTAHRSFIAGESDDATASSAMRAAGVIDAEVARVLELWKEERALIRKQLTPAQVKKAYRGAVPNEATGAPWTRDDALAELLQRGYNHVDATTFLDS